LLDHNEVDIVCTLDTHIYNTTYIIRNEEKLGAHFVCSPKHPLAREESLSVEALLQEPFLLTEKGMSYRRLLDAKLAEASLEISPFFECGRADLICKLTEENAGISFLPDYVTEEAVQSQTLVRLPVENFEIELWKQILYHRDKWISPQMQVTMDYLAQISLR
jgi:DNA-binding transcriptional LysR family regulator